MFVKKRSVLAYGLQSRIVWNFMKFHFRPETHSCARDGKNQESFVRNVRVKCFKQLWYWISGIIALSSLLCRDLPGTGKSLGSKRNVFGCAFVRIFLFASIWVSFAHFLLIFSGVCALKTCSSLVICMPIIIYNIFLAISTTKRVNTCWVSSHFGDEVVPRVL